MITVRIGKPGEGKSLTASMDIREALAKGIPVYSNLHLNETSSLFRYFRTEDWEVIYELQNGQIVFDEGQFILDARRWDSLPVEFRQLLQKGRHEGLDFTVLTQNIMQIDVAYRRLIHEAESVHQFLSWRKYNFGIFFVRKLDLASILTDKEIGTGMPMPYVARKEDWEYYDSYALRTQKKPPEPIACECGSLHRIKPVSG